jgi:hypothetical protein
MQLIAMTSTHNVYTSHVATHLGFAQTISGKITLPCSYLRTPAKLHVYVHMHALHMYVHIYALHIQVQSSRRSQVAAWQSDLDGYLCKTQMRPHARSRWTINQAV